MIRYIILILIAGIVGSILAKQKGRSPVLWFILCAMVPLVIIAIILLPPMVSRGYTKKCPHCAEIIKEDAKFCKHCGLTV